MLNQKVELTGYAREDAIHLLNHVPENTSCILCSRLLTSRLAVQQVLFLVWEANLFLESTCFSLIGPHPLHE